MAHELDRKANGTAAMFSVRETPWHREGEVLSEAPTREQAMVEGGLDFDVELFPMTTLVPVNESGDTIERQVPGQRAVVRMDRLQVLGTVGPTYHVLQNRDAFQVLDPLVDAGVATIETGGALRGGRDVWMMVKFALTDPKVADILGKEVEPYALISNNHSGARKVVLQETPVRVVCANTLGFALRNLSKAITVRHTASVAVRVVEAANELFGTLTKRYQAIADQYDALKRTVLEKEQFDVLVLDVIAPKPEAPKANDRSDKIAEKAFERAMERATDKRDRVTALWTEGDGHVGDYSAWEAYNAATQSLDHDTWLWSVKSDRLESLFDGNLARTKQAVIDSLIESLVPVSR